MAKVSVQPYIPSLHTQLQLSDLKNSYEAYNTLPDDCDQPPISDHHIENFAEMFVRNNAHKTFGVHLVHGHFQIPSGTIMIGKNIDELRGRWTKPINIDLIDLENIHGHIFVLKANQLLAYEYQYGPSPNLEGINKGFFKEFMNYLVEHKITELFGLEVLLPGCETMWELILESSTVMVDSSMVNAVNVRPARITGWTFEKENGRPRACASNETHAAMTSGNHKVFNAGKPEPKLDSTADLKLALVDAGVLKS